MGLFELISHIIFPNEYIFDGDYFRGQPIFNQPQLLGEFTFIYVYFYKVFILKQF